jgi:ribosomal 30S subunit maturation factor RimM
MNTLPPAIYVLGKITSKHGFRGTLHIKWDDEDLIPSEGDFLFVLINQKGVPFRIKNMNVTGELVDLEFIENELQALEIIGLEVGINAAEIPEHTQKVSLAGFQIIDSSIPFSGLIQEVSEYPGQLMLHVFSENREFLIPYVEEWIVETEINTRTLIVKLPEGLISEEND